MFICKIVVSKTVRKSLIPGKGDKVNVDFRRLEKIHCKCKIAFETAV